MRAAFTAFVARFRPAVAALAVAVCALGALASAQQFGFGQRFRLPEGPAVPPHYPPKEFEDGTFMICKWKYTSVRSGSATLPC